MDAEVFAEHPDPLSLLPFRDDPHVNGEANRLMADAIVRRLVQDGTLALPEKRF